MTAVNSTSSCPRKNIESLLHRIKNKKDTYHIESTMKYTLLQKIKFPGADHYNFNVILTILHIWYICFNHFIYLK